MREICGLCPTYSRFQRGLFNLVASSCSKEHRKWTRELFTDEFRYSVNTVSRLVWTWGEEGQRKLSSLVRDISRFRDCGLGRNMTNGHSELHIFHVGSVTARRYVDKVLQPQNCWPRYFANR